MPHATPLCHIKGDMNCVTSPRTGQQLERHGWDIHAVSAGRTGAIRLRHLFLPVHAAMLIHFYPQR
jgi:hypothetical protein